MNQNNLSQCALPLFHLFIAMDSVTDGQRLSKELVALKPSSLSDKKT